MYVRMKLYRDNVAEVLGKDREGAGLDVDFASGLLLRKRRVKGAIAAKFKAV